MAVSPTNSSTLELTISIPGCPSSPSRPFSGEGGSCGVRNLDMNKVPEAEEREDHWRMRLQSTEDEEGEEEEEEEESSNGNGGPPPRKKLRLSKEQSRRLEESFRFNHTLNPKQKEALAMELKLKQRQVEVWFQNRRARSKLKQTEIECEYLKRWFRSLTEQNQQLRREVEELRAIKVAPPAVVSLHRRQPVPISTLTMCPRCERVTATAPTRSSAAATAAAIGSSSPRIPEPPAAC